ncbi:NAD(P)H-dependent oxidoreductase [Membranicola marinus]|uniref:NAD(P)H-dependent oxidoreductase n=1 Tax=Membranihabitans marinus TaxID=1227546 RepID=A0A953HJD2_9BACT|nr:NAD(P)H-dependent oxidoreductase [Membranihabitans marinus]MBY5956797.1 NAD(P)H-dependent oxidoreductase [Membranihabitans marinus]
MTDIVIISSSIRDGRKSHRVALFFQQFIKSKGYETPHILDLKDYSFPLFEERLARMTDPEPKWEEFAGRINGADGVIIVTPEYNGGYPASLKNAIDFMYKEWHRKPMALAAVSDGPFAGTQVIMSLQFTLWKIGAWTVPARYHVPNVDKTYDDSGRSLNPEITDKLAGAFVDELMWCVQAKQKMDESEKS